jgi:hypothetical protein
VRIDGNIEVNMSDPWLLRLSEEGRLAPFKSVLTAINVGLSSHRSQVADAERTMFRAGAVAVLGGGIALAMYASGSHQVAVALGLLAAGGAVVFLSARALRNAFSSEAESMERHLIDAGFKLDWRRDKWSSHRPIIVTLEWPEA